MSRQKETLLSSLRALSDFVDCVGFNDRGEIKMFSISNLSTLIRASEEEFELREVDGNHIVSFVNSPEESKIKLSDQISTKLQRLQRLIGYHWGWQTHGAGDTYEGDPEGEREFCDKQSESFQLVERINCDNITHNSDFNNLCELVHWWNGEAAYDMESDPHSEEAEQIVNEIKKLI